MDNTPLEQFILEQFGIVRRQLEALAVSDRAGCWRDIPGIGLVRVVVEADGRRSIQDARKNWIEIPVNATPEEIKRIRLIGSITER